MDFYEIRRVRQSELAQMDALLARGGLRRDRNLDDSVGIFLDGEMIGTGSCAGNTLRCLTIAEDRQGEGLLSRLVQHLVQMQLERGNYHLFLYTKGAAANVFRDLGFSEIARDGQRTVFMENRRTGFADYLSRLERETEAGRGGAPAGGLVMNANPFTLGHRYLVEQAARACGTLHLFVVSEDVSVFPRTDRIALVRAGTADLPNVICHETEDYLISRATFPSYFLPDDDTAMASQARLDAAVFSRIAEALNITARFVGTEPASRVTALYNRALAEVLPQNGISCREVPRLEKGGRPVSASDVRQAMKDGDWKTVEESVPASTLEYLHSEKGLRVLEKIRKMENVRHH